MTPERVLSFWFEEAGPKHWFKQSDGFDKKVTETFLGAAHEAARHVEIKVHSWENAADSALALIIMLDQFPRNMFRNDAKAFAWDALARKAATRMIEAGFDLSIPAERRAFVYMPFMHGEDIVSQDYCVELCRTRLEDPSTLRHAIAHRDLIKRFGRFPYRNDILGRESTREEVEFLASGGYSP